MKSSLPSPTLGRHHINSDLRILFLTTASLAFGDLARSRNCIKAPSCWLAFVNLGFWHADCYGWHRCLSRIWNGYSKVSLSSSHVWPSPRLYGPRAFRSCHLVGILYMPVNIAYFAVPPKGEILGSGCILVASFFRNVLGPWAEHVL